MATPELQPFFSAPHHAVPELSDYLQFKICDSPPTLGAINAYSGFIRPFSDDRTACEVLRALDIDHPVQVCGGRLSVEASQLRKHPAEVYLRSMATPVELLILKFADSTHPHAYITSPKMVRNISMSPHIRADRSIWIDGVLCPALCVYSGSDFRYANDRERLEQFLDQTTTYLAKYLIWLKTRMVVRGKNGAITEFVRRKPAREPDLVDLSMHRGDRLEGYWPGSAAPSGAAEHLKTIRPRDECWCWTGKRYADCCMQRDLEIAAGTHSS